MELQNSASMPGPLSPGYIASVPFNYNQLEGRFKQLQGKLVRLFCFRKTVAMRWSSWITTRWFWCSCEHWWYKRGHVMVSKEEINYLALGAGFHDFPVSSSSYPSQGSALKGDVGGGAPQTLPLRTIGQGNREEGVVFLSEIPSGVFSDSGAE